MTRGYIYKIDTNLDDTETILHEDMFCDEFPGKECDYVSDCDDLGPVAYFVEELQREGLDVTIENGIENVYAIIQPTSKERILEYKKNHFRIRYSEIKDRLLTTDLTKFSQSTSTANLLASLIENNYSDMVYINGTHYIMDDFIRDMLPETTYYIQRRTILMH